MDHDRLFKELLTTFFVEFIDLFLPEVSTALERSVEVVPMDKEIFTDFPLGDRHEVDVLMKARFRGEEAFFLIHVENQATPQSDFPARMFGYFARLTLKYRLPVYSVVIFSYDAPQRKEPSRYELVFSGKTMLRFDYTVIQLNRLPWRRFVRQENPVASALMAKMKMTAKDRPRVKAECLRLLASLRLDPARTKLIGGFVDSYLKLSAQEMKQYERELAKFTPKERKVTMEIVTSWELKGKAEGLHEGKETLVMRLIRRRLGSVSDTVPARLDRLSPEQLDELGEALFDMATASDLDKWFTQH